jgi:branched-chain amino acid transport system ATP-binding protein
MLELFDVETFYGSSQALFGVSLEVRNGEVVTLLGRNGMGKSTTVRSITGLTPPRSGTVHFDGHPIHALRAYAVARAGVGLVPEGREIFANLTVRENLLAAAANRTRRPHPWTEPRIYGLFPRLAERQTNYGNQLSGGEQQMLAIGRALMTNPRLLILDEATEGLAPLVRAEIWRVIEHLRAQRQSILLIDKNLDALLRIADRHYIMEKGRVEWTGDSRDLAALPELQARYLGI